MKRADHLPFFKATMEVEVFEPGAHHATLKLLIARNIQCREDTFSDGYMHAAKHRLAELGVPAARLEELYFDGASTMELVAMNPRNLRISDGDGDGPIEAHYDFDALPKRDALIRQRRVVPDDMAAARAMYLKPAATKATRATVQQVGA